VIGVSRYDQSHDVEQNREVQPESLYMTGVISSDRSRTYDRSRIFQPESDIRPKSHI
jgi:hypothetical protein